MSTCLLGCQRGAAFLLAFLALFITGAPASAALPAGTRYVMSHFRADGGGGDERLYISISPDGLHWTALNSGQPVYQPPGWRGFINVVRDPAIIYAQGAYWVVYTSGNYGAHASFGLARSTDLLTWQYMGEVSTALPGGTDQLTWSPTWFRDGDGSVHVFVSTSLQHGSEYNPAGLHSYELHPTSADWTQWSAPVLVPLPSGNTNELWVWKEGEIYHGLYVDFQIGGGYMEASATNLAGPWGQPHVVGYWSQEGAFFLKRPEGGYRLYIEPGNGAPGGTYQYSDLGADFTTLTPQAPVTGTVGLRNGKAIAAPDGTTYAAWQTSFPAAQVPSLADPLADADADGLPNVVEYATGLDPGSGRSSSALLPERGSLRPLLHYWRRNGAGDVTITPAWTTDLHNWAADLRPLSITLMSDGTEEVVVESPAARTSGLLALRLSVQLSSAAPAAAVAASQTKGVVNLPARKPVLLVRRPVRR